MRIEKVEYEVYKFEELSDEAKEKVIAKWYENEQYEFLDEDIQEELYYLLNEAGIKFRPAGVKAYFSLSYSQGDGVCFTGIFWTDEDLNVLITHKSRYYYADSVEFEFKDASGELVDDSEEFKEKYLEICRKLEKYGYETIGYRMNNEEFQDHCDANTHEFRKDGRMY